MTFNLFLASRLMREPGRIVGPISKVLGIVINLLYNVVYGITQTNSLGITIILFTVFVRLLMIPIAYNQQKSMFVMRKIQPEIFRSDRSAAEKGSIQKVSSAAHPVAVDKEKSKAQKEQRQAVGVPPKIIAQHSRHRQQQQIRQNRCDRVPELRCDPCQQPC